MVEDIRHEAMHIEDNHFGARVPLRDLDLIRRLVIENRVDCRSILLYFLADGGYVGRFVWPVVARYEAIVCRATIKRT